MLEGVQVAWSGEVVQQVRVFATKPDNLTLAHGSHVVKGEDWLLQAVL